MLSTKSQLVQRRKRAKNKAIRKFVSIHVPSRMNICTDDWINRFEPSDELLTAQGPGRTTEMHSHGGVFADSETTGKSRIAAVASQEDWSQTLFRMARCCFVDERTTGI